MDALVAPLESLVDAICRLAPPLTFFSQGYNVYALLAVVVVSLICGAIGSLVVGNRMAFFSDALAHCAFAGVALGLLIALALKIPSAQFRDWIALVMVVFGVIVGLLIVFVRDRTGLASDTVIGVFFAGAIGLGAVFTRMAPSQFNIESFIFGQPTEVKAAQLVYLVGLLVVSVIFLGRCYNDLVLASVNPSLALSRNVSVQLNRYLFVILLGLIVNLCLQVVGALLINALLIVPAATAANLCRNLRQLFWTSVGLCVLCGVGGQFASWEFSVRYGWQIGAGGTIVVLTVLLFVVSMLCGPAWRNRTSPSVREV